MLWKGCVVVIGVGCQYMNVLVFFFIFFALELLLFLWWKGRVMCIGVELSVYM